MSKIGKALRNKRFQFKDDTPVRFLADTPSGNTIELKLINCSLHGIGARLEKGQEVEASSFVQGIIWPSAKITWKDHEYTLGRVCLRNAIDKRDHWFLGFSTVDSKVPVDGPMSQYLDTVEQAGKTAYDFELSTDRFTIGDFLTDGDQNDDLYAKGKRLSVFLGEWKQQSKYSYFSVRTPSMGVRVNLTTVRKNGRTDFVIMGSNDYLGLSAHPEVMEAAKGAIDKYGVGSTGSPVTTGISEEHTKLCKQLSNCFQKDDTMIFNSGYAANLGIIPALTSANDLVISDILSHASIQDAMQMGQATGRFFKHNDVAHLEKILKRERDNYAGCLIVTEGIFSMDGDCPPLREIVEVAKKYRARVMVDEAHSLGVIGPTGLGAVEKFQLLDDPDIIIMGTFSKICGGIGGFVSANKDVLNWIKHTSRAYIFSVSPAPSSMVAASKALELSISDSSYRDNLQRNIKHFVDGLCSLGFEMNPNHESAVVPVVIGDEDKLGVMNQILTDSGVFVVPIVFPAVSRSKCRFRFTMMASHTTSDLDYVLNVIEQAMSIADFDPRKKDEVIEKSA